jgi:hypothetical protein
MIQRVCFYYNCGLKIISVGKGRRDERVSKTCHPKSLLSGRLYCHNSLITRICGLTISESGVEKNKKCKEIKNCFISIQRNLCLLEYMY